MRSVKSSCFSSSPFRAVPAFLATRIASRVLPLDRRVAVALVVSAEIPVALFGLFHELLGIVRRLTLHHPLEITKFVEGRLLGLGRRPQFVFGNILGGFLQLAGRLLLIQFLLCLAHSFSRFGIIFLERVGCLFKLLFKLFELIGDFELTCGELV